MAENPMVKTIGIGSFFKTTVPHRIDRVGNVIRDRRAEDRRNAATAAWFASKKRSRMIGRQFRTTMERAIVDSYAERR